MRRRTVLAVVTITLLLAGLVVVGLGLGGGLLLSERWVSDTARDNEVNHHPIGVGPDGQPIVAPVSAVPTQDAAPAETDCVLASLAPEDGSVLWRYSVPAEECMSHALTEPTVGDLEGDGRLEIAVSTTEEAVVVLDATEGRERFRVEQPVYGYGPPTIADVHPAEGRELVASDIAGNVVLVHANGSVGWRQPLNESFGGTATVWEGPIVGDVDADGAPEITIGARDGPVVLAADGTVEWVGDDGATHLVTAQVDDDTPQELIVVDGGTVRAIDGATHEREWERDFGNNARLETATNESIYLGLANGTAVALDGASGDTRWTTAVTGAEDGVLAAPVLASIDGGDESSDVGDETVVIAAARDGTVAVLDRSTGAERAAYQRDVPVWTYPTPADLDGDGTDEILVRYGDGRIVALTIEN